jgi:hypothetical protein
MVELDEQNVLSARRAASAAGLDGVEVIAADASVTDVYADDLHAWLSETRIEPRAGHRG